MKTILRNGFLALAVMALAVPASAGPYGDGNTAYQRGDYATAFGLWRPLAVQGDANAQFKLGNMHHYGQGVAQDFAEAMKWYRLAAALAAELNENDLIARTNRHILANRMTPDQIAEARRMAREWMAEHQQ